MLRLSKKSEYALMAVKYIALQQERDCITAKEIAVKHNLSYELISKILQRLVKSNVICSIQGARGGYRLSKLPSDISLMEIISAVEPGYQITECFNKESSEENCEHFNCCMIRE